jgi:hypothetical protein
VPIDRTHIGVSLPPFTVLVNRGDYLGLKRARALLSIAAPEFREELGAKWRDVERRL